MTHEDNNTAPAEPPHDAKFVPPAEDALHIVICQAVQEHHGPSANAILRTALNDYKPTQLTRTELIRVQQRGGSGEVTAMMVSPAEPEGEREFDVLTVLKAAANYVIHPTAKRDQSPAESRELIIKGLTWAIHELESCAATPPETPVVAREECAKLIDQRLIEISNYQTRPYRVARRELENMARLIRSAATTPPSETAVGGEAWTSVDNWPVDSVLGHLADATEHLLSDHECDCCGWETWKYATEAARKHVALLTTPDDDLPVCLKCKHFENLYPRGRCLSTYRDAAGSLVYCACKCEFAAPVHAAGDDEGEWCDDCRAYTHTPNCPSYTGRNQ